MGPPFEWFGGIYPGDSMTNQYPSHPFASVIDAPTRETGTFLTPMWVRLGARLFAGTLDVKLSLGTDPASSHLLAARAQQLVSPQYRRGLADAWLDLLIEVRRPRTPFDPVVSLVRYRVLEASAAIHSLADALVAPLPTVRGLATAIAELRDGTGPLFNPASSLSLTRSVEAIVAQLNPLTATV